MQYHYVVGYDTETKKWFMELDTNAYFPHGNVYDVQQFIEGGWGWYGPDGPEQEYLDQHLLNTLYYLVDTIPTPEEV